MSTLRALLLGSANSGPTLDLRFADGSPLDGRLSFTRTTTASYFDATGTLQTANSNVPRIDYGPLAVTTNAIRNSTTQGAVPGTPGTAPTNWQIFPPTGASSQIVGSGIEAGIPYVDVRFFGTSSTSGSIAFEANNGVPALVGQTWTQSAYYKLVAGSFANITNTQQFLVQYGSTGTFLAATPAVVTGTIGSNPLNTQRFAAVCSVTNASTAYLLPEFWFQAGGAIDFTIRIGAPQLEQAAAATAWVPTGRYNGIRNSVCAGAVPGTPGTVPTNWATPFIGGGLTGQVVGSGTESGIPYLDYRISGTANATTGCGLYPETSTGVAALTGQTWCFSTYMRLVAGSLAGITVLRLNLAETTSGGATVTTRFNVNGTSLAAVTSAPLASQRLSGSVALSGGATVANLWPAIDIGFNSGAVLDFTLRIGAPQLEQGAVANSWMPVPNAIMVNSAIAAPGGVTNWIRNSSAAGAVAGTPGTLPTNWATSNPNGLTTNVIATGTLAGLPYADVQITGTPSGSTYALSTEVPGIIACATGQTWTTSIYLALVGGSTTNISTIAHRQRVVNASVTNIDASAGSALTLTATLTRFAETYTLAVAGATSIYDQLILNMTAGQAVNITLRIAAPQLELGATPTAWIPTTTAAANVGALPLGLLIEEQRTNSLTNPRAEGAVAGTPGTMPTGWAVNNLQAGVTGTVVGTGVERGLPYVDLQYAGTPTASGQCAIQLQSNIAATAASAWTYSTFARLVAGSLTNVTAFQLQCNELNSSAAFIGSLTVSLMGTSSATQRFSGSITTVANTAFLTPYFVWTVASGSAISFTIRLMCPQLELGAFATSPILPTVGSPAATTRAVDNAFVPVNVGNAYTIAAEGYFGATGQTAQMVSLNDRADTNRLRICRVNGNATYYDDMFNGSGTFLGNGAAVANAVKTKLAAAFNGTAATVGQDGTTPFAGVSSPAPVNLTAFTLGSGLGGGQSISEHLVRARYWPRALSSGELAAVTT